MSANFSGRSCQGPDHRGKSRTRFLAQRLDTVLKPLDEATLVARQKITRDAPLLFYAAQRVFEGASLCFQLCERHLQRLHSELDLSGRLGQKVRGLDRNRMFERLSFFGSQIAQQMLLDLRDAALFEGAAVVLQLSGQAVAG